jgi:hypothetical protein
VESFSGGAVLAGGGEAPRTVAKARCFLLKNKELCGLSEVWTDWQVENSGILQRIRGENPQFFPQVA